MPKLENMNISIPECPIDFSFHDLKETPEVKSFLASPEGKERTKISFSHLLIPDKFSILVFVAFLPLLIVVQLATLDPNTTVDHERGSFKYPEYWNKWIFMSGAWGSLFLIFGGIRIISFDPTSSLKPRKIRDEGVADETTPLLSTSSPASYIKVTGRHPPNQILVEKYMCGNPHRYLLSKDAIVDDFKYRHGWPYVDHGSMVREKRMIFMGILFVITMIPMAIISDYKRRQFYYPMTITALLSIGFITYNVGPHFAWNPITGNASRKF